MADFTKLTIWMSRTNEPHPIIPIVYQSQNAVSSYDTLTSDNRGRLPNTVNIGWDASLANHESLSYYNELNYKGFAIPFIIIRKL